MVVTPKASERRPAREWLARLKPNKGEQTGDALPIRATGFTVPSQHWSFDHDDARALTKISLEPVGAVEREHNRLSGVDE